MSKSAKKLKFEEALTRLERIIESLESGEVGIDESLAGYEEAMKLVAHCRKTLDEAEQRIRVIQTNAAGDIEAAPFEVDDEDSSSESQQTG